MNEMLSIYEKAFKISSNGWIVFDKTLKVIECNQMAQQLTGVKVSQDSPLDLPKMLDDFRLDGMRLTDMLQDVTKGKIDTGQLFDLQLYGDLFSDKMLQLCFLLLPEVDFPGIAMLTDITSVHKRLKALNDARLKAEESNRLKTAFLANMSHEIRTPLNSIIGFSDLVLDEDPNEEELKQYVSMIKSAGKTLLQLVDDIIDISRIESGQIKVTNSRIEVAPLMHEILQLFENERKKRMKSHLLLRLREPSQNEHLLIYADPYRFRQILSNLLSNALKFTDEGYIEFGCSPGENGFIQFFVKDTGTGIDSQSLHRVFQRFGQLDTSFKRNREGAGLGLAISKQLVELMGGRIWFDTEEEKGTTFYFTLPMAPAQSSKPFVSQFGRSQHDWADRVFLVVDDVEANYLFYRATLKPTGALVLWAKNGAEAIKACKNNPAISLVLMDIQMPKISGYDATQQIRLFAPTLPIIAQTAFGITESREKAIEAGCSDYITKPVNQHELMAMISSILNYAT